MKTLSVVSVFLLELGAILVLVAVTLTGYGASVAASGIVFAIGTLVLTGALLLRVMLRVVEAVEKR